MPPTVSPRLASAAQAAANNLAAIANIERFRLVDVQRQPTPYRHALLQVFCAKLIEPDNNLQPLDDTGITPQQIAAVLETIALLLSLCGSEELAGHNPSWFVDASRIIE